MSTLVLSRKQIIDAANKSQWFEGNVSSGANGELNERGCCEPMARANKQDEDQARKLFLRLWFYNICTYEQNYEDDEEKTTLEGLEADGWPSTWRGLLSVATFTSIHQYLITLSCLDYNIEWEIVHDELPDMYEQIEADRKLLTDSIRDVEHHLAWHAAEQAGTKWVY